MMKNFIEHDSQNSPKNTQTNSAKHQMLKWTGCINQGGGG
jgi:hypothetical protein